MQLGLGIAHYALPYRGTFVRGPRSDVLVTREIQKYVAGSRERRL